MKLTGVMIFCKDMKTMIAFYRDVVGLTPDEPQPFPPDGFFRFLSDDGADLCLHRGTKPNGGRQKLMFHTEEPLLLFERIRKAKRHFKTPEPDEIGRFVFDFYDPERNRIQVYARMAEPVGPEDHDDSAGEAVD